MNKKFKRDDQVAYIPLHANGNILHPDSELGFISHIEKPSSTFAFVRYWSKVSPNELRTKANSEATPVSSLVYYRSKPQEQIEELLKTL